jgi:hypothetical protein
MILHSVAGDAAMSSEAAGIAEMLGDVGIGGGASSGKPEKVSKEELIDDADEYDEAESEGVDESDETSEEQADEEDSDESEEAEEDADEDGDDKADSQERLLRILENLTKKQDEATSADETEPEDEDPFQGENFTAMIDALALDSDGAKTLKTFMQNMLAVDRKQTIKDIMRELPKVTEQTMTAKQRQESLRTAFYESNPQLKPVQGYVSAIAKEVASDPKFNKNVESILAETAKRSYAALGLKKGKAKEPQLPERGKRKPAFPNSNHSRKKTEKPGKLRSEIDAMLEAL